MLVWLSLDKLQEKVTEYVCAIQVAVVGALNLGQIVVEAHELLNLPTHSVECLFI